MAVLDKDKTILNLLRRLGLRLGPGAFDVVDHWEVDLCAVGIASPRDHKTLAYLSTFKRRPGRYDVELELPSGPGSALPYLAAGSFSDVDFEALVEVVRQHLSCA